MAAKPWLISVARLASAQDEARLHRRAEATVTKAYRQADRTGVAASEAFDCALRAYRKRYPDIPPELAGHAVADILTRHGLPHDRSRSSWQRGA